tara:strand:+ start:331 stop:2025 length:1695 start_codon:yes stop_codon:yes gene_type:complete
MAMIKHFVIVLHGEQSPGISDTPVGVLSTALGQIPISQSFLATTQGNPRPSLTPNFMMLSNLQDQIFARNDGNTIVIDEMSAPGGVFLSTGETNQKLRDDCLKNPIWKKIVAAAAGRQRPIATPRGFVETGESKTDASFKGAGLLGTQIHEYSARGTNWFFDHLVQTDYGDPTSGKGEVQDALNDFGVFSMPLIPLDPIEQKKQQQQQWTRIMGANDGFLLTNGHARQIRISDLMLYLIHNSPERRSINTNVQYQFSFVICNPPITHSGAYIERQVITQRLAKINGEWTRFTLGTFVEEHQKYWLMVFYTDFLRFYLYNLGKQHFLLENANLGDFNIEEFANFSEAPCALHTTGRFAVMDDEERQEFIINIGNYLQFYPIWLKYQAEFPSDPLYQTDIKGIMEYILKASTTPIFEKFDEQGGDFWGISQLTSYNQEEYTASLSKHIFPKILTRMNECFDKNEKKKVGYYYELLQYVNQKHYPHSSFFSRYPRGPSKTRLEKFKQMCQQIQQTPDQYNGGKKHKSHIKRKKTKRRKKKSNKKSRRKKKTRKHRRKRKKTKLIYRR